MNTTSCQVPLIIYRKFFYCDCYCYDPACKNYRWIKSINEDTYGHNTLFSSVSNATMELIKRDRIYAAKGVVISTTGLVIVPLSCFSIALIHWWHSYIHAKKTHDLLLSKPKECMCKVPGQYACPVHSPRDAWEYIFNRLPP